MMELNIKNGTPCVVTDKGIEITTEYGTLCLTPEAIDKMDMAVWEHFETKETTLVTKKVAASRQARREHFAPEKMQARKDAHEAFMATEDAVISRLCKVFNCTVEDFKAICKTSAITCKQAWSLGYTGTKEKLKVLKADIRKEVNA